MSGFFCWLAINTKTKQMIDGVTSEFLKCINEPQAILKKVRDSMLPQQDEEMLKYANYWAIVTERHKQRGTYKKFIDFMKPERGLHLDIGTGAGGLIEEFPTSSVLAVDINHHCLKEAYRRIKATGKSVRKISGSYITLDKEGFHIEPQRVREVDLTQTNLVIDNIKSLANTKGILQHQGRQADGAVYALNGGHTDFLEMDAIPSQYDKIDDVARLCKHGAKLLLVLRDVNFENGSPFYDPSGIQQKIEHGSKRVQVEKSRLLYLGNERDGNYMSGLERAGLKSMAYLVLARVR